MSHPMELGLAFAWDLEQGNGHWPAPNMCGTTDTWSVRPVGFTK